MLKEMGVSGIKTQEIFSLDEMEMGYLPRPIHALIFLFRYVPKDDEGSGTACPDDVWFANQIPDFACGTVALLNIIYNIPDLELGRELDTFRNFTADMDPYDRGQALDGFDFVRKIHNSFARQNDMLNADALMRDRFNKSKRQRALEKAKETRRAKKAGQTPLREKPVNAVLTPCRSSKRVTENFHQEGAIDCHVDQSSPLSELPDSDEDFKARKAPKKKGDDDDYRSTPVRQSARKKTPRRKTLAEAANDEDYEQGGFHFIAYIPIRGHVWKLDGMDYFPEAIGAFDEDAGTDWLEIAAPIVRTRMALNAADGIEFNLMAVVGDPIQSSRSELAQNIRALQEIDKKLDAGFEDWRDLEGAETKSSVIMGDSSEFGISCADVSAADITSSVREHIDAENDLLKLIELRQQTIRSQNSLRVAVRDTQNASERDENEAWHRRFDYGAFVTAWLEALADNELLAGLIADT